MWPFSADEATWRPLMRALRPDYLFSGGRVLSGASLVVQDGVVQGVGDAPADAEVVPMRGRALLPGMVVAHSHAFQRRPRERRLLELAGGHVRGGGAADSSGSPCRIEVLLPGDGARRDYRGRRVPLPASRCLGKAV